MSEPIIESAPMGFPAVSVTQGLPDVQMVVTAGSTVSPSGEDVVYTEGETFTVDGPTAIALAAGGYATAVGADAAVEAPAAETSAEVTPEDSAPATEEAPEG
jgi:hypothetical protein